MWRPQHMPRRPQIQLRQLLARQEVRDIARRHRSWPSIIFIDPPPSRPLHKTRHIRGAWISGTG